MNYIKSMRGLPLWEYEDLDLQEGMVLSEQSLRKFVLSLREHLDSAGLDQWTQDALRWAVGAKSRHLSCRSLQVTCCSDNFEVTKEPWLTLAPWHMDSKQ